MNNYITHQIYKINGVRLNVIKLRNNSLIYLALL